MAWEHIRGPSGPPLRFFFFFSVLHYTFVGISTCSSVLTVVCTVQVCKAGTKKNQDGLCEECPAGTFSEAEDVGKCTKCPPGSFTGMCSQALNQKVVNTQFDCRVEGPKAVHLVRCEGTRVFPECGRGNELHRMSCQFPT